MIEPEFRAWCPTDKNMSCAFKLGSLLAGDDYDPDWIIMQCTGLHDDRNAGRKIFEGDIVIHPDHEPPICMVVERRKEPPGMILTRGGKEMMCQLWDNQYEVVGNVYENPGLLK